MVRRVGILALATTLSLTAPVAFARVLRVGESAETLRATIALASAGDVVELPPGRWNGPVVLDEAIILRGRGGTIDGGGEGTVIRVTAAGAQLEGLRVTNSGSDLGGSDACIFVTKQATGAIVRGCQLDECAFGIWVDETHGAQIIDNTVEGRVNVRSTDRGNGIHLFAASHLVVRGNHVARARDGIYVLTTEDSLIEDNRVEHLRFGIHYMYSYRNTLRANVSADNIVGIALMESRYLIVEENQALRNERDGLLFRDVQYSKIRRNVLEENGIGMFFFSSTENEILDNRIAHNEVGMKVWAGTRRNLTTDNRIVANRQQVFYVGAEDQQWGGAGRGNYWGDYLGWDYDGDGVGDRPHRVDSFTARLLYQYPAAVLLMRSPALEMLSHLSERFPLLRTPTVVDVSPLLGNSTP